MANLYLEIIYRSETIDQSATTESSRFKSSLEQIIWQSLSGRGALRLISQIRNLPHSQHWIYTWMTIFPRQTN